MFNVSIIKSNDFQSYERILIIFLLVIIGSENCSFLIPFPSIGFSSSSSSILKSSSLLEISLYLFLTVA